MDFTCVRLFKMHFEESDEEKMFREGVREFAQKHVAPAWQEYDRSH
ncbi:MAG: acyl-CoA dehydrogenase family protein, partial [Candidatus Thorarchaeota archaeon]